MQTKSLRLGLLAGASLFAFLGCAGSLTLALDTTDTTTQSQTEQKRDSSAKKALAQAKLDAARLKACQTRERVINNKLQQIAARGAKHLAVFNKKAERVMNFATTKGKKPANYDALVADVSAKKAAALAAVGKISAGSVSFDCDGSDPKGVAEGFKADLRAETEALKAYKQSIRNLLVAVVTANKNQDTTTGTGGSEQ
jgi:hypothetical protein